MTEVALDSYILDLLMRDLGGQDKAPSAFLIYLQLWNQTPGKGPTRLEGTSRVIPP